MSEAHRNGACPFAEAELIGVGIGPGESALLTIKAAQVLSDVDVVFAPASPAKGRSLAADIVVGAGIDSTKLRELAFSMSRDAETLRDFWLSAARSVVEVLDRGETAAFITLGDPSVYSTWIYLRRSVEELRPDTRFAIVPGVMAMNAAAAGLSLPLVEGREALSLVPLPHDLDELEPFLPLVDQLVVYKIGARLPEFAAWLDSRGLADSARLAVGVGLDRESFATFRELPPDADGYLSVALVRTGRRR